MLIINSKLRPVTRTNIKMSVATSAILLFVAIYYFEQK